jgi:hypothetical protein
MFRNLAAKTLPNAASSVLNGAPIKQLLAELKKSAKPACFFLAVFPQPAWFFAAKINSRNVQPGIRSRWAIHRAGHQGASTHIENGKKKID